MKPIQHRAAQVAAAGRVGFSDLAAIYTLRTWFFGWFARLVMQVIFFTAFGFLLGSVALAHYRLIGNSAALVTIEATAVVLTLVSERDAGTLTMQVLAPSPLALTYLGRGAYAFIVGIGSSTAAFVIGALIFRLPVAMPAALLTPLCLAVMAFTSYCYALALGVAVMARPSLSWLTINVGYLSVMTFSGVNVPVAFWPAPVRVLASVLPLSHGLTALRLLLAGGSYVVAVSGLAIELAVGAGWLTVGLCLLGFAVHRGRVKGTLDLTAS
jgi:ABC-2 type transport system permease protein